MVVRAPTNHSELYVLTQEKFRAAWLMPGTEIIGESPEDVLLRSQGFMHYRPSPTGRWIYEVTAEDLELLPVHCFITSWGIVQHIRKGDFLATPAGNDIPAEVYLMPPECAAVYRLDRVHSI